MAKKAYKTWVQGELVTANTLNEQIKDNGNALWVGDTAGDMEYYSAADQKTKVPIGANGQVLRVTSGLIPAWTYMANNRQGGNATNWFSSGSTNYVPTGMIMQMGTNKIVAGSKFVDLTFSPAFSGSPLFWAFPCVQGFSPLKCTGLFHGGTGLDFVSVYVADDISAPHDVYFSWFAIGPA